MIKHDHTLPVIFGPGVTSEMYAVNESVPIDNLLTATKTMAPTIVQWCGIG